MIEFKGSHFEHDDPLGRPLVCGLSNQLSTARGNDGRARVEVDHSTLNRWVVKYVPLLDPQFLARERPVGSSWRLDENLCEGQRRLEIFVSAVDKAAPR